MSLESEIARLVDVLEKGFAGLTVRQSEIISLLGTRAPSPDIAAKPADIEPPKRGRPKAEPAASPATVGSEWRHVLEARSLRTE